MEEKNVHHLYQPGYHRLTLDMPLQQRLRHETHEGQESAHADEDATVRSIVAMVGAYPEDAADHLIRDLMAAEIRYVARAAYRHGCSSRD